MSLIFWYGSGSPFAWRVWLALEHKGVPYEARRLHFDKGETRAPAFLAVNPRGKVPAISHDGWHLHESGVILEYLDEAFPEPTLLPGNAHRRALARLIAREADEVLYPMLRRLVAQTLFKPKGDGDPAEIAAAREALAPELARLEDSLDGDWLAGALSLADFTLYPHLRMLRRIGERMPQHDAGALIGPRLAAWMGQVEALPYYERTTPPHWRAG
jgi:glutathione S-transferase